MLRILNKYDKTRHRGYTLAEMLIVLVIVALILMALPRATKKLFPVTAKPGSNGRMECYYQMNASGVPVLTSYMQVGSSHGTPCLNNGASCANTAFKTITVDGTNVTGCVFEPPKNAVYMALYAVGGGGGGASPMIMRSNKYYTTPVLEYVTKSSNVSKYSNDNRWPQWLKNMYAQNFPSGVPNAQKNAIKNMFNHFIADRDIDNFDIKVTMQTMKLRYTQSGKAGKLVSMFFPQIDGNATMVVVPGTAGSASNKVENSNIAANASVTAKKSFNGNPGTDTRIFILWPGQNPIEFLRARGGAGGIVYREDSNDVLDAYVSADQPAENTKEGAQLVDTEGLQNEMAVLQKSSGFVSYLTEGSNTESNMAAYYNNHPELSLPGDGGRGAFNVFHTTQANLKRFYFINDYDTVIHRDNPVKSKLSGSKWTNVSTYVSRTYRTSNADGTFSTGNCERKNGTISLTSDTTFRAKYYGTCTTMQFGGGIYCTMGNSTDIDDNTCKNETTTLRSGYHNVATNVNYIPQNLACTSFKATGVNLNAKVNNTQNRCSAHVDDGVKDSKGKYVHCTVQRQNSGSHISKDTGISAYSNNRYTTGAKTSPAGSYNKNNGIGCYYDNQIGYVDSTTGNVVDKSPTAGRIVCIFPPEPDIKTNYMSCPSGHGSGWTYHCPDGSTTTSLCKPSNGGNGAVVLLW